MYIPTIPEGDLINDSLRSVEEHMDNINELLPGLPEDLAEEFLEMVQNAEVSLEEAHRYLR